MSPPRIGSRPVAPPRTAATTAPAPRAERAPTPTASPVRPHSTDAFEDVRATGRPSRDERTAAAVYRRHGDTEHSLTDRADVGRLISRSPQLDDLRETTGDSTRCGGAAVFNAMLLDGDHAGNARAIETVASQRGLTLSDSERSALSSMREGHLTPHEAARLQETVYRIADTGDSRAAGQGLSGAELATAVGSLRAAGGFANTQDVNFRTERTGPESSHWTTTSTTAGGVAHADSWPAGNGYATVAGGPGSTDFHHGGRFDDVFISDVTLNNTHPDGSHLRTRSIGAADDTTGPIQQQEVVFNRAGEGRVIDRELLDRDTGAPTVARPRE